VLYCQGCWGLDVVCEVNRQQLGCGQFVGRQCVWTPPNLHEDPLPNVTAGPLPGWCDARAMQI
jgi:hypothetical protein